MRAIVLTSPSSIVALILLIMGLQTGLLGYEQLSEVRVSDTASRHNPRLFPAKESGIENSMEANIIEETRDAKSGPHPMGLVQDAKTNPADDKRRGSRRATHPLGLKSITVSWLMKTWPRRWRYRPAAETQEIKEIKQRYMALSQKIRRFEEDYPKMHMGPQLRHNYKLKKHISNWRLIAGVQYARKVNQLRGYGRDRILWGEEGLPREVFDMIYEKVVADYLTAFGDVVRASLDYRAEGVEDPVRLVVARWSDLMLDFFVDLKELGLLPSLFRSASERGFENSQFVASYLLGKFPPFDVASTYLNLDLRTSILEDTNIQKLKDLSHQFDEATWKEIEFQFLKARLEYELAAEAPPQGFEPIMKGFIQGGQLPDGGSEMGSLFQDIIRYIPKAKFTGGKEERLVHFKVLYDMLRFIYRYNSHPEQIISGLEGQQSLLQLRTFEECIRFISSLNYFHYKVSKLFLLNLRQDSLLDHLGHHFLKTVYAGTTRQRLKLPDEIRQKLMGSHYLTDGHKQPKGPPFSSFGDSPQDTSQEDDAALAQEVILEGQTFKSMMLRTYRYVYESPRGGAAGERLMEESEAQHTKYLIQAYKLEQILSPPGFHSMALLHLVESLRSDAIYHAQQSVKIFANTITPFQQAFDLTHIQRFNLFEFSSYV